MNEVFLSLKGRHRAGEGAELAAIFFGGFFIPDHYIVVESAGY